MTTILKVISFLRWRIVAVRYLTMVFNAKWLELRFPEKQLHESSRIIQQIGFTDGPTLPADVVKEILSIYQARAKDVPYRETGAPFSNLVTENDIHVNDPIMKLAFSKEILDAAIDYFGTNISFDSIQLLYSYPTSGKLRESQMWHKDFGDNKSFHAIIYLNDVLTLDEGPFVFIDKKASKKVKWSPFVRRISDEDIVRELGGNEAINYFYGKAGSCVFVDPAVCYHFGSRCKNGRLAIFITFNSSNPFVSPFGLFASSNQKMFEIGKVLRPDLDEKQLKKILGA